MCQYASWLLPPLPHRMKEGTSDWHHESWGRTTEALQKNLIQSLHVHKNMDFLDFMDFLDIPEKLFGGISRIVRLSWDRIYYDISHHFPRTLGANTHKHLRTLITDIKKIFYECVNMHSGILPPPLIGWMHIGLTPRIMRVKDDGTAKKSKTILACPQKHGFHWFPWYSWATFRGDF